MHNGEKLRPTIRNMASVIIVGITHITAFNLREVIESLRLPSHFLLPLLKHLLHLIRSTHSQILLLTR